MGAQHGNPGARSPRRQHGQSLFIFAVLVALGILALVVTSASPGSVADANRRNEATNRALFQVKEALIGWSVQRTNSVTLPNARPGELPCPDMDNDGSEDGTCAAGAIGRVPWRTLGIPPPADGAGEMLWYAIAGPFRIWNVNANPINSDTRGNITVHQNTSAAWITTEAVAVIFAPGPVIGTQDRNPSTTALCSTTGSVIARNLCAANYLETAGGINNATPLLNASPPSFIQARPSSTFNDGVMVVTTADLITPVERRAAREILALLQAYRNYSGAGTCNCYPWADDNANGTSNSGEYWGRVPLVDAQTGSTPSWAAAGVTVPTWMTTNQWWWPFFYTVSDSQSANHGGGTLTVDGTPGFSVVLITTGPAGAGRPPGGSWDDAAHWPLYVDDSQNSDGGVNFQTPSSTAYARDRLFRCVSSPPTIASCTGP